MFCFHQKKYSDLLSRVQELELKCDILENVLRYTRCFVFQELDSPFDGSFRTNPYPKGEKLQPKKDFEALLEFLGVEKAIEEASPEKVFIRKKETTI